MEANFCWDPCVLRFFEKVLFGVMELRYQVYPNVKNFKGVGYISFKVIYLHLIDGNITCVTRAICSSDPA